MCPENSNSAMATALSRSPWLRSRREAWRCPLSNQNTSYKAVSALC